MKSTLLYLNNSIIQESQTECISQQDTANHNQQLLSTSHTVFVLWKTLSLHAVHLHTCFPPQSLNNEQTLASKHTGEREQHMIWEGKKNTLDPNGRLITQRAALLNGIFWGHRQFWVIIMLATHVKLTQKKNKCYLGRHLTRVSHTATVFTCIAVRFRQKPPNTGADFSSGQIILIQWLNIRDHESLPHCIRVHHSRSKTEKREEGDAESNETQSNSHPLLSRDHSIGTAKGR